MRVQRAAELWLAIDWIAQIQKNRQNPCVSTPVGRFPSCPISLDRYTLPF
ncbi:hypothetical protein RMSM_06609 [Rhodopirellula maiorica SM1]|uniref:Uncharacterized protein n=1 Tax=Rhodopirellula maiorica SM1 TaxID=1265738 RepID=M5RAR9_9BACT|nr:hypothetical protein RMSM_06609 [Rhodopirellula maiorica SM1]